MKTIHKYQFAVNDVVELEMPVGAQILSLQVQNGVPCIWAKVETAAKSKYRRFRVYGTGHPISEDGNFIGTFQMHGGTLVFHMFEVV